MPLKIELAEENAVMTAYLDGEIDHHSARAMREEIDAEAMRVKPKTLILNFENVTFMDSSGIGLIMGRYRLINYWDARLKVSGVSPGSYKVMRLAGLDKLAGISKKEA